MRIGKLLAAVFGALVLLGGAGMTTAGAVALGVADGDGWVGAPEVHIGTDAAALVGADIDIDLGDAINDRTFVTFDDIPLRIDASSRNGKDVFVGIGSDADVDAYLAGGSYALVEFWHDDLEVTNHGGAGALAAPAEQTFWAASSTTGDLEWDVQSGQWSLVVMNADGSSGVDVSVDAAARIPFIEAFGIGLLVFGVMAIVGGAVLLYFGVRSDPTGRGKMPASPPPPPAPVDQEPKEPATVS